MKGNNWFQIKGLHSRDIFELVESISLTPLSIKSSIVNLPERDGSLNFTRLNEFGRALYEDRIFTISAIARYDGTKTGKNSIISKIYDTLYNNQVGTMTTSETFNSKWDASLESINSIDSVGMSSIRVVIQYRVSPFSYGTQSVLLNQKVENEASLTLNCECTAPCTKHTLELTNIQGNVTSVSISNGKNTLYINKAITNKTVIDFKNYTIKESGVVLKNTEWDGEFFELNPGINNITIVIDGSANILWEYLPSYYYSVDIGGGAV